MPDKVTAPPLGIEWIVDARGCDPGLLRDVSQFRALFERIVHDLALKPVGEPRFHVFPGEGGLTGLLLLSESHLTCHTYPESAYAAFNLYCCRQRSEWPWSQHLRQALQAQDVHVRTLERPGDSTRRHE